MKFKMIFIISLVMLLSGTAFSNAAEPSHFTGFKLTPTSCNYAGKVNINCIEAVDGADEVAVFVYYDTDREILIGACVMGDVVEGHYFVTVYGDDPSTDEKDGAKDGDSLIFKVWDKSEDKTYRIPYDSMTSTAEDAVTYPSVPPVWTETTTFGLLNLSAAIPDDQIKPGNINGDCQIDLTDAILGLQIFSGITPSVCVYKKSGINNDGRIGLEEIVYVLQHVSGIR